MAGQQITFGVGAARAFTEAIFKGPTTENEGTVALAILGSTATVIVDGNGDRVGLTIANVSTGQVYISTDPAKASAGTAFILSPKGGILSMIVSEDYTLPTRRWYGCSDAGAQNVEFLEVFRVSLGMLKETSQQG